MVGAVAIGVAVGVWVVLVGGVDHHAENGGVEVFELMGKSVHGPTGRSAQPTDHDHSVHPSHQRNGVGYKRDRGGIDDDDVVFTLRVVQQPSHLIRFCDRG